MKSSSISTDICIIGAGPAGITASLTLSQQHIPHIVVDSDTFPRTKACGDILTWNVLRELNKIDPEIISSLKQQGRINPIWRTYVYPPNGTQISIEYPSYDGAGIEPTCYSIQRSEFDQLMIAKAQEYPGVTLRTQCRIVNVQHYSDHITLTTHRGETIDASMVIVATGSNSSLTKYFGGELVDHHCSVGIRTYYRNIDSDFESCEFFLNKRIMPGGIYISPLPDKMFNVNMVMFLEKVQNEKINLQETFETVIATDPALRKKFIRAERISPFEGSKLAMGVKNHSISGDRFIIAGDAASLIDIISANGISQAMVSGRMAATHAAMAVQSKNFSISFMREYETSLYKTIEHNLALGKALFPFLRKTLFGAFIFHILNFLGKRPSTNVIIRDLLYHKNVKKQLINPKLYYRLLFK
jgi:flavin-dependent dehydrogenase